VAGESFRAVPLTAEMPTAVQPEHGARGQGSTLSSPAAPAGVEAPANANVNVAIVPPKSSFGETLPSKDGGRTSKSPDARRGSAGTGVGVGIVVALVLAALGIGFASGFFFGRL
jgi:hypothetical protein